MSKTLTPKRMLGGELFSDQFLRILASPPLRFVAVPSLRVAVSLGDLGARLD
jgi:hypothetical protein